MGVDDGESIRRSSNPGDPARAFRQRQSYNSMGKRNGKVIPHQFSGAEEGLPACGFSRSLRSGTCERHSRRPLYKIRRQQELCCPCRGIASGRGATLVQKRIMEGGNEGRREAGKRPNGCRSGAMEQWPDCGQTGNQVGSKRGTEAVPAVLGVRADPLQSLAGLSLLTRGI